MDRINNENTTGKRSGFKQWVKRIGVVGVLFFLVKGLVWLAIFAGLGSFIQC